MSSSNLYKVFVYGTLKRGQPNHEYFEKDPGGHSKFLCEAETVEKYPLIIATKYNIPFLLYDPGTGNNIKGEVYEVDEHVLVHLDELEDHPNFYIREEKEVQCKDGSKLIVWIYVIKKFKRQLLKLPFYNDYDNYGSHGLKYVKRYNRTEINYNHKADVFP